MIALVLVPLCALLGGVDAASDGADADARTDAAAFDAGDALAPDAGAADDARPTPPPVPVSGVVLVKGSRDPLAGASVLVDGVPAGETDAAGRFTVLVPPGRRQIRVADPGFEAATFTTDAAPGGPELTLRLERVGSAPVYESVVRAPGAEPPRVSLVKEEITKTPGSLGDPFRVIESLPGVTQIQWPLPVYAVRGANPGNTGFFVDGLRVPSLFHFALGPAVIHPYFLETLDFYPGGYPARYGRHVAGVVAASTAAPPADRVRGSVDLRLFDAGAIVSSDVDHGRGTVALAGRYGYPAALLSLLQDDVRIEYWDYQGRFDHPLGPGRLTAFVFGSYDLAVPKELDDQHRKVERTDEQLRLLFHRLDLRYRQPAGRGRLTAGLGLGFDETTTPFEDNQSMRVRALSLLPRLTWERPLGERADLELGADGELTDYDTDVGREIPEAAGFLRSRSVRLFGVHGGLVLRLGPRVVLVPGLRLDAYHEGDASAFDVGPRLTVRVQAAEGLWAKVSGGRFSQLPTLPLQLPGLEGFGLAQHGLQTAWQGSAGLEAELGAGLSLDTSVFAHRYQLTDIRDPDVGDPLLNDFLVRREALSYGVELMIRRPPSNRLHGWLSYTLSRSLRAFEGGVVGPSDWDRRHVLNLVLGYRLRRWTLGGRLHVHTGRYAKIDNTEPAEFARLPTFVQVDARIERRFVYARWVLDAYLEVVNAGLRKEVAQLRRTPFGLEEQGFTFALPSLGVRAEY